jgi:hypothetical protein
MDEFDALVAAAGISPNAEDMAALKAAWPSLQKMKARLREVAAELGEPAHVFRPATMSAPDGAA